MKNTIKLFVCFILCAFCLFPTIVKAELASPEYEITWGLSDGQSCGVGAVDDPLILTSETCKVNPDTANAVKLGEYNHSTTTFTFEKDASVWLYGHEGSSKDNNTIIINGNNTLNYIYETYYNYKITGSGRLIINSVYARRQLKDESGTTLQSVFYKTADGTYVELKDAEGKTFLVTTKDEVEAMFDTLKANNASITDTTYNAENFQLRTHYETFKESFTEDWVKANIVTDLPITYNNDGSISIGTAVMEEVINPTTDKVYTVTNDKASFTSKDELDKTYTLETKDLTSTVKGKLKNQKDGYTLLSLYDISVLDANGDVVVMENGEFVIRIKLTEEMKKHKTLVAAYIKDGKVIEEFNVTVEEGHAVFKTTHLSEYAIFAKGTSNPSTADPFAIIAGISVIGLIGSCVTFNVLRKKIYN